jgi:NAD(P)-dependent dehydrogenase (short-subunit alcohol dehydrogenase family)
MRVIRRRSFLEPDGGAAGEDLRPLDVALGGGASRRPRRPLTGSDEFAARHPFDVVPDRNFNADSRRPTMPLAIADKTVLVTGANRGLGRALVDEALRKGARRVYAASRQPLAVPDERVTPVLLDVTDRDQIEEAARRVGSLDILINNAGVSTPDDLRDRLALEQHLAVNLYGVLDVTHAFLPSLTRSRGAVVNIVSIGAVAAIPVLPAYSISKAASLSVTQSLRARLAGLGVSVFAVMPGPIDTDMVRALDIPKTPPVDVARSTLDAVERGDEDIFPDPMSQMLADGWGASVAKTLERQNAGMVQAGPVAA